jgi:uncharacterized membrane protein YeaQ/YmgE (transglycosylase-associated protein family)
MDILSIDFLGIIAVGVVAGLALGSRTASPFRETGLNVVVGVAGSVAGFGLYRALGLHETSLFAGFLMALAGAVLLLVLLRLFRRYSAR